MISLEQIQAVDNAIVLLTHAHPGCKLHVGLDEIGVETDDDYLVYDVYYKEYKDDYCETCNESQAPSAMDTTNECSGCAQDRLWKETKEANEE